MQVAEKDEVEEVVCEDCSDSDPGNGEIVKEEVESISWSET